MEKTHSSQKIYLYYLIIFIIIASAIFSIFVIKNKSFIWQNDGLKQHFIILKDFHEKVREFISQPNSGLSLFSWEMGLGMDVIGQYSYYVLGDPFAYISLLFPQQYLEIAYVFLILLRMFFIGFAFIQYAKYHHHSNRNILLGAILYTFCSFSLFAGVRHPYFLNAMILFPFLLLGVDKLLQENKKIPLMIWVAVSAISNYYFFYMHTIMLVIYAVIRYLCEYRNEGWKNFFKKLGSAILAYLIGILIAGVILFPTIYAFLNSARTGEQTICQYTLNYYKSLFSLNMVTVYGDNWSFIGIAAIILPMLPVLLMRRKQHKTFFVYLMIAILFLLIPFLGSMMNGFSFPNNRWAFVCTFILSYIVTLCWDKQYTKKEMNAIIISMILYAIIAIVSILSSKLEAVFVIYLIQIMIAFLILCCIGCQNITKESVKRFRNQWVEKCYQNRFMIATFILSMISIMIMAYGLYSSYDRNYVKQFIEMGKVEEKLSTQLGNNKNYIPNIQEILQKDKSFYRIAKVPHHVQNLSIYYGYASTECFVSIGNQYVYQLNRELADHQYSTTCCVRGLGDRTKITTLLGTKYYITDEEHENCVPYGYDLKEEYNGVKTYENQYPLSIGTVYTQYMTNKDYEKLNPVEKEDALLKAAVIDEQDLPNWDMKHKSEIEDMQKNNQILPYQLIDKENIVKDKKIVTTKKDQSIDLEIPNIQNSEIYVYISGFQFQGNNNHTITATFENKKVNKSIENKITSAYYQEAPEILLPLGYYEKTNGKINIKFSTKGTYQFETIQVIAASMDSYEAEVQKLQKNQLKDVYIDSQEIRGNISIEENGILQIATSYTSGWKAYVDGKTTETIRVNTAFIGIPVEAGEHQIYLKYEVPYLGLGIICTVIGIFGFISLFVVELRKNKNQQVK